MDVSRSRSDLRGALTGGLPVPRAAKLGGFVIAIGLLADALEHAVLAQAHLEVSSVGFSIGEHLAHLVVVVGMVLVLVGIVIDGARSTRRSHRQEGKAFDAVR